MRKILTSLAALCCLTLQAQQPMSLDVNQIRKLMMTESAITNLYVEDVDENKIVEAAIRAMLKELDPHSTYNDAAEVKRLTEPLQGNFEGIGVQFNMAADTLIVIQTVSGGPSQKVGILAGDRIVSVDHDPIAGVKMSRDSIMQRLRGPKGTRVELGVVRRGVKDQLTFIVTRDVIPVHTLEASFMVEPKVGYIRLGSFGATTHDELVEALRTLLAEGMESLVLDLEGNGGGYLQAAVEVASEFLNEGDLIVYTEGRRSPRRDFHAVGKPLFAKGRMAVIVDEYSASAAEIVTGALQAHGRAVIVGRRTFGKGLVQQPVNLPDGSMVRLTVAHYYTPTGQCVQKPYGEGADDYSLDLQRRYKRGEMMCADSIPTDLGGIIPDRFVAADTVKYTRYHRELVAKGAVNQAVMALMDQHRREWERRYKTVDDFCRRFTVTDDMLATLQQKADEVKVKHDDALYDASLPLIRTQLKALIARDLWDMSAYFRIINETNDAIPAAIEAVRGN